jgi:hypothetical protein
MASMRPRPRHLPERRILADSMRQPSGQTRAFSPRQLPTDHDHAGEPSRSIREYQSDLPSTSVASAAASFGTMSPPATPQRRMPLDRVVPYQSGRGPYPNRADRARAISPPTHRIIWRSHSPLARTSVTCSGSLNGGSRNTGRGNRSPAPLEKARLDGSDHRSTSDVSPAPDVVGGSVPFDERSSTTDGPARLAAETADCRSGTFPDGGIMPESQDRAARKANETAASSRGIYLATR